jgi:hypothetical protein
MLNHGDKVVIINPNNTQVLTQLILNSSKTTSQVYQIAFFHKDNPYFRFPTMNQESVKEIEAKIVKILIVTIFGGVSKSMELNTEFQSLASYNPVLNINYWIKKHILWRQSKALFRRIVSLIENIELLVMQLSVSKLVGELIENAELLITGWHGIAVIF